MSPDITVTVTFHHEGAFAAPALASMRDLVNAARAAGLVVEARAVLDRADDLTRHLVATRGEWLCGVQEISAGDVGLARNAGVAASRGVFLAFLDGDDLWGADWLRLAHKTAIHQASPLATIWHPESLWYFYDSDFEHHTFDTTRRRGTRSFHMMHGNSDAPGFDRDALFLNNLWTANVLTSREMHQRFPYQAAQRPGGLGCEDWSWNIATTWAGIPHRIVKDTVHLIRVKATDSLGHRNATEGLLPYLPPETSPARFGGGSR